MSVNRIRGDSGVVIQSEAFLELPKAPTKLTPDAIRNGMIRYNKEYAAFEGVLDFTDGTVAYRRFANLDENGKLLVSQLPDTVTSGLQFKGTYDPLEDDIDPPSTLVPLPAPDPSLNGDYLVVRGIMDLALDHYSKNTPSSSPVTFIPVNPTGQGDWMEVLYYIDQNPVDVNAKIVSYAFARIDPTKVPSTGHDGLVNLIQDPQLTAPFDTSLTPQGQSAFSDGDWVISADPKNIRLRQNRTSINASSVLYDSNILFASDRPYTTSAGTVQTTLDNIGLEVLRRTGDAMADDGKGGGGRLAIMYGDAKSPSLTFNSLPYDPKTNPGTDPTKWSDNNTGIFHPVDKTIGFSTNGIERLRITNSNLTIYQTNTTTPQSTPTIKLEGNGNTNVGITALNNTFTFASVGKSQVEFADSLSSFHGDVTIDGNLITKGTSTLQGAVQLNSTLTVNGVYNLKGNGTIGTNSTNTLLVNSSTTFAGNTTFNGTNKFKNLNMLDNGVITFEDPSNQSTLSLQTNLELKLGNYIDFTIFDGTNVRTKFGRYGIKLPVLTTVDDSLGEDGMVAYSPAQQTSMQKVQGKWVPIGTGKVLLTDFTKSSWVLSGTNYTLTIPSINVVNADIHELTGVDVYNKVEVDSIQMSSTGVVYSIPATPDVRFDGRAVVTVSK